VEKINVLQLYENFGFGAGKKTPESIAKYSNKRIFNFSICVLEPRSILERKLKYMGAKIYHVEGPKKFAELIKKEKIHVIHTAMREKLFSVFANAALRAGALAVILYDSMNEMVDLEKTKSIDRHGVSKMCALRYRKWQKIPDKEFHKNYRVWYIPVDLDWIESLEPSRSEILRRRKKLGIKPDDLVVGRVGRPDIGKWSDVLIDMMPHLIKKIPNVKFLVIGIPEGKKEEIEKRKLGKYFILLKPIPSDKFLMELLYLIDIFAYSSVSGESFGMSIVEAMACKKPVVVNSTPLVDNAQVETVDNGKTGFVVYSPEAFAEAIVYLASHPEIAKKMGLAGHEKVRKEYEGKKAVKMLEKRILELVAAKGMEISPKTLEEYENVAQFPSPRDIDNFEDEYKRRLRNYFGKPDLVKIFVGEHVAFSPLMLKFIRSIGLTNLRNMIVRSFGAR